MIPEVWQQHIVRELSRGMALLPAPPEHEREWLAYRRANARWVELPRESMSTDDACAAIRAAAAGLQNTSVDWGDEYSGPAVEGFVEGAVCNYGTSCPLLLGHSGKHDG